MRRTSNAIDQGPQYSIQFSHWKTGADVPADDFAFKAPADAKQIDLKDHVDIDELPAQFLPKDGPMTMTKKLRMILLAAAPD